MTQPCPYCGHQNPDSLMICAACKRDIEAALAAVARGQTVVPAPPATRTSAGRTFCLVVHALLWIAVALAAAFSAVEFLTTTPESAPQQAAVGAYAAARVLIAYGLARAWDEVTLRMMENPA